MQQELEERIKRILDLKEKIEEAETELKILLGIDVEPVAWTKKRWGASLKVSSAAGGGHSKRK